MCLQILYDRFLLNLQRFPPSFLLFRNISWATVHIYTCVCQSVHFLGGPHVPTADLFELVHLGTLIQTFSLVHNVVHIPLFASGPLAFNWKAFLSDHSIGASFSLWTGITLNLPGNMEGEHLETEHQSPVLPLQSNVKIAKKKPKNNLDHFGESQSVYGTKKTLLDAITPFYCMTSFTKSMLVLQNYMCGSLSPPMTHCDFSVLHGVIVEIVMKILTDFSVF